MLLILDTVFVADFGWTSVYLTSFDCKHVVILLEINRSMAVFLAVNHVYVYTNSQLSAVVISGS